jgi:hypothetical protein
VVFGNFLVVPIDRGFLYVLPVFVEGKQEGAQTFPQLKQVVVFHGNTIGLGTTLDSALADSFTNAPPPNNGGGNGNPGGSVPDQIKALLADASQHFQAADAALKAGDLGTYQKEVQAAESDIAQAQALANGSASGSGTPTPSPGSSPTTGPTTGSTTAPSPTGT